MLSDIEIARSVKMREIADVAADLGIAASEIEPYGHYIAKVPAGIDTGKQGKLILVTAITATKAGIGKTTASIGLAMGLNKIGKKAVLALREPSLGPCFGMKGGAAGGGWSQVVPMEKINLHFTGDFHAITSAHNMISALLDNYLYQRRKEGFSLKEVVWKRVLDVNDRSLRNIVTGLGARTDGQPSQSGFDITPASEIMAIFCLASDLEDLRRRIENILLGYTWDDKPFTVKDLGIAGSIVALLMDAVKPNLVQTTEGTPAFVHGGPFANIAHGCNTLIATRTALALGDYVVTEAGFGADLGGEKFLDIKCRKGGLQPSLTMLVCTLNGLKMHGGVELAHIKEPSAEGVRNGFANLDRHIRNLQKFGQTVLVCLNKFASDTQDELDMVREHCEALGVRFAINEGFARGGEGAVELAKAVADEIENNPSAPVKFIYPDDMPLEEKICAVAKEIYGAATVSFSPDAKRKLASAEALGLGRFPVCVAKTQYSFSQDPKAYGAPSGFNFDIRDIVINTGSEMIVAIAGDIIRMPGLPKVPAALSIDVVDGNIEGLS